MKKIIIGALLIMTVAFAEPSTQTHRTVEFSNDQVNVWKTLILPSANQKLEFHRHENNRVLVALTDGILKITNDKGQVEYLTLKKDHAYFLPKNLPNEKHTDVNIGKQPIEVMVIELKS